jgi:hypothetical protein
VASSRCSFMLLWQLGTAGKQPFHSALHLPSTQQFNHLISTPN